ncbi:MAG: hypothetical protein WBJ10_06100 [Daejeonella sp.]|uniref:hypothetical protein n=1 Tax=Daejeonella sp. TaxID=2805397 RepID=UPI003C72C2F5
MRRIRKGANGGFSGTTGSLMAFNIMFTQKNKPISIAFVITTPMIISKAEFA